MKKLHFFQFAAIAICFLTVPNAMSLTLKKRIIGKISPKSVVHNGHGLFFAQNMMYRHTVTIYNRSFKLLKTLQDRVQLKKWGVKDSKGWYKGAPVEVTFSHQGRYAWVSNYKMYGHGFRNNGTDGCSRKKKYNSSYLYKIDTKSFEIIHIIKVGSVPKYLTTTPDQRWIIVSNWCSGDISIVDTTLNKEVKRIAIGRFPRGLVVSPDSKKLYVSVMGSTKVIVVDTKTWTKQQTWRVGFGPRHLTISPNGKFLYITLNSESRIAKVDTTTGKVLKKARSGSVPRSMTMSNDGNYLYIVNYKSDTVAKMRTRDMKVLSSAKTWPRPIGITFDNKTKQVWVACYSGAILVYQD